MDILHKFDDELLIAFSEEMGYNILENQKNLSVASCVAGRTRGLTRQRGANPHAAGAVSVEIICR